MASSRISAFGGAASPVERPRRVLSLRDHQPAVDGERHLRIDIAEECAEKPEHLDSLHGTDATLVTEGASMIADDRWSGGSRKRERRGSSRCHASHVMPGGGLLRR